MKELQELINNWKKEADDLQVQLRAEGVSVNMMIQLSSMARRLRSCIADAELLISKMQSSEPQPQLDKGCVSGRSEQLPPDYWQVRCALAEKFIDESPCDPDITKEQTEAWAKYQDYIKTVGGNCH